MPKINTMWHVYCVYILDNLRHPIGNQTQLHFVRFCWQHGARRVVTKLAGAGRARPALTKTDQ